MTPGDLANHVAQEKRRILGGIKPVQAQDRIEYSRKEFAQLVGCSSDTLKRPKYYLRYGGRKRGGRIVFPASAVEAIRGGQL